MSKSAFVDKSHCRILVDTSFAPSFCMAKGVLESLWRTFETATLTLEVFLLISSDTDTLNTLIS